jgi:proteasome lid subunit RPN8/RPN11
VHDVRPADNVAADRQRRFEVDPATLFAAIRAARDGGPPVLGHYHSHPGGSAEPSATDAAMIRHHGELWIIVAGPTTAAWVASGLNTFVSAKIDTGPALASQDSVGQSRRDETGMPG